MWTYIFFFLGFLLLIKGADWLLNGAMAVAQKMKLSGVLVGLTIVALGTSLPELIVTLFSTAAGEQELLVGGIVGSNLANILLILGVAGVICPISLKQETVWREIPLSLLAALALGILASDTLFDKTGQNWLSRTDSLLLLLLLSVFLYYLLTIAKKGKLSDPAQTSLPNYWIVGFKLIAGVVSLYFGGWFIVNNALEITQEWGVSQTLVGASLVALGTSLPELITSIIAATKKQPDIVVGNVIGSNIFNIFLVLGLNGALAPIVLTGDLGFDLLLMIFAHLLLFLFLFIGRRHVLQPSQAWVFLAIYATYLLFLIVRH